MLYRLASDEQLVARVRGGSAAAFDAIFDRHHRPLLAFCRSMLGSVADAEDAVQHTFMAAYADLVRSDKPIALRPWLYSIARNRCLTMLRAQRERPVAELPEPGVGHVEFEAREELRATLADIAHLPEDQRAALVLAELGDVSHAEIAQVLGCRQEKVKALVFQARSTLATGRTAREVPCADIREQLVAGGLAIRRTFLRKHVRDCAGCREFGEQLRLQRRRLRILLPVAPGLGLKRLVLGAVLSSGGGVTAGGLAATAIVTVTIAGGGGPPAAAEEAVPRRAATAATTAAAPERRPSAPAARPRVRPPKRVAKARRRAEPAARPRPASTPVGRSEPAAAPTEPVAARSQPALAPSEPVAAAVAPASPGKPKAQPAAGGRPDEPAAGRRPDAPPGHERRATPPEPPGKPAAPPGNPDPGPPPAGGPEQRPDDPPGLSDPDRGRPRR